MDIPQIQDTLSAALFAAAEGRVRFVHRALAEFLAARWLAERRFSRDQILSLLVAPSDDEVRIVPQLREVAAWTVALRPDLLGELLRHEPDVLLRIEQLDLAPDDRARVVAALLDADDVAERVELFDRRTRRVLRSLVHPGLSLQLRPALGDQSSLRAVRRLAVTIAGACAIGELQHGLLPVVALTVLGVRARSEPSPRGRGGDRVRRAFEHGRWIRAREALVSDKRKYRKFTAAPHPVHRTLGW